LFFFTGGGVYPPVDNIITEKWENYFIAPARLALGKNKTSLFVLDLKKYFMNKTLVILLNFILPVSLFAQLDAGT